MFAVTQKIDIVPGAEVDPSQGIHNISFYGDPPTEELSVDDFEIFALDRLQLLRNIENLKIKTSDPKTLENMVEKAEKKYLQSGVESWSERRRKDICSHFILRLAYCRSNELRSWMIEQETTLFHCRLQRLQPNEVSRFMQSNGLLYETLPLDKRNECRDKLIGVSRVTEANFPTMAFYRVPFQQAIRLLASRSVYLEAGYAFVPHTQLVSVVTNQFRANLSRALAEALTRIEIFNSDERIDPLLKNLNKQYVGKDFSKVGGDILKLTADQIDAAADAHMPLCMRSLHSSLRRDHKLKYQGRFQYSLFLKGAGLELEDLLMFFESHFSKLMTHDQFVKGYAYNFRHLYGKEGSRKNLTPLSCAKIIMGPPPMPGQTHGCPYKHSSDAELSSMLASLKISSSDIGEIKDLAKSGGHYQIACQKHFDVMHPDHSSVMQSAGKQGEAAATHPNAWYHASTQYFNIKKNGGTDTIAKVAASSPSTVAVTSPARNKRPHPDNVLAADNGSTAPDIDLSDVMNEDKLDEAAYEAMLEMGM